MKKNFLTTIFALLFVVIASAQLTNLTLRGTSVVLSGAYSGTNPDYVLMTSTNLALSSTNWFIATTNSFPANGRFTLTNPVNSGTRQQYYSVQPLPAESDTWVPTCGAWLGIVVTNDSTQNVSVVEAQIGRRDDVIRIYHTPGSWTALTTAEKNYLKAGRRLLESVKPSSKWSNAVGVANGGSVTVDSQMTSLAQSVASIKPAKIMLIVWHEPENDVGTAGTTNEYVEMWHNVQNIFRANGATNVIWCWDIQNTAPRECSCSASERALLPFMWPGNTNVDWVMWDPYCSSESITDDIANAYNWMLANSTAAHNWASKPFGVAEWGVGINSYYPTVAQQTNGMNQMSDAFNKYDMFPQIKLVEYYDDLASAILPGAWNTYSNFANSPYVSQHCP
ncbi:MAG TPA: hypothetical protein VH280_21780 [Verrucomicrobiae bacterium]|jgi:hypothetical protein|nr:hypothetical protein [Verrucomicrobiae bacterium]